ncbi:polysaccharide deacetylase family protein [Floridanema aerugineum]|uniref:Polysaccharide deacetylase family protein n=1 Tax=Floridaenema aerugineum BLCC-F46 TaxID=3153654 RepID=A0ABV4XID5_9CYAN
MYKAIANLSIIITILSLVGCNTNYKTQPSSIKSTASHPQSKNITPPKKPSISSSIAKKYIKKSNLLGKKSVKAIAKTPIIKPLLNPFSQPVPILMYHSIGVKRRNNLLVAPDKFAAQIKHLHKAGYQSICFQTLENHWKFGKPLPAKPILLTFDDGYKDNYTIAYPILKKYRFKATIFVISNFVGDANHLSQKQIKEMMNSGLIDIGAHTKTHPDLTTVPSEKMYREIFGSRQIITKYTGKPVIAFAYPIGRYNYEVVKATGAARYKFAVTTKPGYANAKQGWLTLHRVRINGDLSLAAFSRMFP